MTQTTCLFRDDAYLKTCEAEIVAIRDTGVILSQTVFYAEGGGQPGDTGELSLTDGTEIIVTGSIKDPETGDPLHLVEPEELAKLSVGMAVTGKIDWDRRYDHMRMHTLLHLMLAAVPAQINGCQIGAVKSRIDFDLQGKTFDKVEVTEALNAMIQADHAVGVDWIAEDDLAANPDLVRTLAVAPPAENGSVRLVSVEGLDLQPCGGTHVRRTSEIGQVQVSKIENKGRQNRRFHVVFETD